MSYRFIDHKINYIHSNPVELEIVDEAEYYLYNSARDYGGMKELLNVEWLTVD